MPANPSLPRPDFLIIGAMKCGTTTLHSALVQHPDVFFPEGEVNFFTIDDFEQQRKSFAYEAGKWTDQDYQKNYDDYVGWYAGLYASRKAEKFAGEDAPSYLPSKKAPARISKVFPDIKLVIILRDPVSRAWSNYWHNVNRYNAFFSFEETLRLCPEHLIDRSCYTVQIEHYLRYFDRGQFLFLLFEDLMSDFAATMSQLSDFLGLPPFEFHTVHANKTPHPENLRIALLRNYLFRHRFGERARKVLPEMPLPPRASALGKLGSSVLYRLADMDAPPPVMQPGTRLFLGKLLRRENRGLEDLIGRNLSAAWPSFRG